MFNPSRLRIARKRRGLSMTRLAALAGLIQRTLAGYEGGEYDPTPATLEKLARLLEFPVAFFMGDDLFEPQIETVSFRSMKRMTAGQRDAALMGGTIAFMLNDWIEKRFLLPIPDLLDLPGEDPEAAAEMLRQHWGLGVRPIKNMVHLLEAHGIRVYSLAEDSVEVDAFSLWKADKPFVFLNTLKSAEHERFDAAHELAHLVLHRHGGPKGIDVEKQAHRFASAFLMPRDSVLSLAPRMATVEQLIKLKKQWLVSVGALAYRLNDIGLLTEWHYRSLCIEIAQRGYRKKEPQGIQHETSQVLAKVFAGLRDDGVTKFDVADDLSISIDELNRHVFGLILLAIKGGLTNLPSSQNTSERRLMVATQDGEVTDDFSKSTVL